MTGPEQTMATATYLVTGMTCDHCTRAVADELRNLGGIDDVIVELVPGGRSVVTVVGAAPLTTAAVAAALDEAGEYKLTTSADA